MTNVNQAPLPRLSKAPLVRASLVKRRYIKYMALPFTFTSQTQTNRRAALPVLFLLTGRFFLVFRPGPLLPAKFHLDQFNWQDGTREPI